ncbi:uncharacterized protein B0T23DRAFT_394945 [Neurospora hispaniola]|uniref:Uncharacterized protein n=1 Tax=Neurospora hispaniola TaxID=588809 RepID=A0AAJ0IA76_9PEZI|nr:hypothetical protein B0T23DRAFT_394945 [Neurospora hispaniola]
MESSFDEEEKRFLLGEIIKVSVNVDDMIEFIKQHNIHQPDWHSIQIPRGRTVNQCIQAYNSMVSRPSFQKPILSPRKRNSVDDSEDHYAKRRAVGPAEERPLFSPMRPYGHQPFPAPIVQPVNIQPRPNGLPSPGVPASTSTLSAAPTGRKRGRPKKDESRARQNMPQPNQPIAPAPIAPSPRTVVATSQPLSPLSAGYHGYNSSYRYSPVASPYDPVAASKSGQHSLLHPESVPRTLHMTSSSSEMGHRLVGDHSSSWPGTVPGREHQQQQQQQQQQQPQQQPQTPTSLPTPMEPPVSSHHSTYPTNRSPRLLSSGFGGGGASQQGQITSRDTALTASEQGRSSVQATSV